MFAETIGCSPLRAQAERVNATGGALLDDLRRRSKRPQKDHAES